MKVIINTLFIIVISVTILNCSSQKRDAFKPKEVYKSNDLIITQIAENSLFIPHFYKPMFWKRSL